VEAPVTKSLVFRAGAGYFIFLLDFYVGLGFHPIKQSGAYVGFHQFRLAGFSDGEQSVIYGPEMGVDVSIHQNFHVELGGLFLYGNGSYQLLPNVGVCFFFRLPVF